MKKALFVLFAVLCVNAQLYAQTITKPVAMGDVVSRLQSFNSTRVIEKAYLQFDEPYYNPGDTMYFKAYVTMGERNELSSISGVLHVDLISKNDSLMQSLSLQLTNGIAWGDFALPAYTPKGNFRVRAYTQWMQNSGDKCFFNKVIPVTGKSITRVNSPAKTMGQPDVQFFPEGGSFVVALPSKIAFKAIGADGLGIDIKGSVVDNTNQEIAKFTTAHLGMGVFNIKPEAGKTYKVKVIYPNNTTASFDLPKPAEKGMVLNVNNTSDTKVGIEIDANKAYYLENKNKDINIVMFSGGVIKSVKTVLDNQSIGFDLPKKDLRTGILQVTVFSQDGVPVNERLVFIQNGSGVLNLSASSDKPVYGTHSNVNLSLNAKNGDMASTAYLSAAVVNDNKVQSEEGSANILSDLLLSTDVRGYVEQPGYYFNNVTADTRANLDILMLTQGYRRFVWADLLNEDKVVAAATPEVGLLLSGYVKAKDGKSFANEKVTLVLSNSGQSLTQTTDANGHFAFENLGFADKTRFLVKLENNAIKNKAVITIDKNKGPLPVTAFNQPAGKMIAYTETANTSVRDDNTVNATQLKQVDVRDKPKYRTASLSGGHADQVFFHKDLKDATTLSVALSGKARGVNFANGAGYLVNSTVVTATGGASSPMLLILDGARTSISLDDINPNDVENVEILKGANASIYGVDGAKGVIVVNSRQGGDDDGEPAKVTVMSPGLVSISPAGFYKAREFYTPKYDVNAAMRANTGTVYWKPNITTDKDGNAMLNFTTESTGTYSVVVEGLDAMGNIGRSVIKFKVQ